MSKINVIQIGLGPLGQKICRFLTERRDCFQIVGAVDKDKELIGKDLGQIAGIDNLGVAVKESIGEAVAEVKADIAVLTTVSDMERITPQIIEIVESGLSVVSTCEELAYPWDTAPQLAAKIDQAANKNGVKVIGTGVNPGFLMDFLPIALTAGCQQIDKITISRLQNAESRRIPFQKKIGAGLTLEQFEQKKKEGSLRHVGLTESMQMIASRMGWRLCKTEDVITPIVADSEIKSAAMVIKKGEAMGVQQIGRGFVGDQEKLTLIFRAAVGLETSEDTVEISGSPNIKSTIEGGVNGDIATCAITLNTIKQLLRVDSGLKTMADVPTVSWFEK